MDIKIINDFHVNFARACHDHTFATRTQVRTPRDSQRNKTGKCMMNNKTQTTCMWILRAHVRITLLQQGSMLAPQGTAKGMKMGNVWLTKKNINDLYVNCACACQDHTFVARIQVGTPRDNQRNENGKRLTGKNHKRLLMNFSRACQDHTFAATIQVGSQGAARGMKMENACWVKNYKRHLCEFSAHLPGLQFCNKDPSWDPKAQPKEWK